MKYIADNFVHSVVTDPPYEIRMMNMEWDTTGIAFNIDFWKECKRVLRPGGYLLAFSSTKNYHRMAYAIEDAGFEIRDKIDNFYDGNKDIDLFWDSLSIEQRNAFVKIFDQQDVTGFLSWVQGQGLPKSKAGLKPANEPICVARKPLSEKTLKKNILKWGTGTFNIEVCRIGDVKVTTNGKRKQKRNTYFFDKSPENFKGKTHTGRYPANVIFDEITGLLLDKQSGFLKSGTDCVATKDGYFIEHKWGRAGDVQITYGDSGGASRFFYCAKACPKEKGSYNNHPTVKPLKLIKYLVRLVTPVNGISLDLFAGSGTHALACIEQGINYIGFEKERKYYDICLKRIMDSHFSKTKGESNALR
ncbi:MAG: site-specific DNA-methyltransferase [Candidatus Methanomethylophilus sp.]|nr:site-specific DNA-methyltransferase [Methanomethylophilus sp.]